MASRPVTVVEIHNPFEPEKRTTHTLDPRPGETLDVTLWRIGADPDQCALVHGGQKIEPGEAQYHVVMPGDLIYCAHTPGGGTLRIVGMIGILVATAALTGGLGDIVEAGVWGALGISTATTAAMVAAGIAIGGNLLMSAFLGPSSASSGAASVTYDPTGPKTLAQPGTPIPKGYGTMGWGGNIISSFVDQDGANEYLNVLVCFGWGVAKSISDIFLNQKPITAFRDLTYQVRPGTNDQTPIQGFSRIQNTFPQEIELLAAQPPVIVPGTGTNTSGLQIAVKFPGGLMRTDSSGNPKECSFAYKIEVSPHNANAWTAPIFPRTTADVKTTDLNGFVHFPAWVVLPTDRYAGSGIVYSTDTNEGAHTEGEPWSETQGVKVYSIDNSNTTYDQLFQGEWHRMSTAEDLESVTDWWAGWRIVSNMTDQSFYDIVNVYGLVAGQWDCRITKWGAGPHNQPIPQGDAYMTDPHYTADGWVWDVNEIQFDDLAYPNMILLGIRALATDQLSGANIQVLATIEHDVGADTVIPSQLSAFEHDNPALVLYDILANPLYGMNSAASVDLPSLVQLANYCDEQAPASPSGTARRFVFAGVFDQTGNAWGALQQTAAMCLAQVIQKGNKYAFVVDAPTDISQIFTEANFKKGSFQESFIAFDDRCNQIECDFADAARNWRTDLPVSVITAQDINSGQTPKITRTNLLGCTSRDQAWRWAYFHLLSTNTLLRTVKFSAALEAVSCERGSVIGLQSRQWGYGGRVQAGSTPVVLMIDRDDMPTFTPGAGWTVGVIHPVVKRGVGVVNAVSLLAGANTVSFATVPMGRLLKIVTAAGVEVVIRGTSGKVFLVDDATLFTAGTTCAFYDQDVFDVQTVNSLVGEALTVASPFLQTPTPDAPWVYSQSSGAAPVKLFRVTDIKKGSDFDFDISAMEYSASIYADLIPQYGEVVPYPTTTADVSNVAVKEQYQRTVSNTKSTQAQIAVTWDAGANTVGALIYGSVDGSQERLLSKVTGTGYTFSATLGDVWVVRVVGVDTNGASAAHTTAPTATLTVQAATAAPAAPTNIQGYYNPGVLGLTWDNVMGESYEIRYSADPSTTTWDTAAVLYTNLIQGDGNPRAGQNIPTPGTGIYMVKAVSGSLYSLTFSSYYLQGSSSTLNLQGSITPNQAILISTSVTGSTATLTAPTQSLMRPDGTSLFAATNALTVTGLAPSTTYYLYTFVNIATGRIGVVKGLGSIPDTAPNPTTALATANDGRYPGPVIQVTTAAGTGGGSFSGGGAGVCPDGRELVSTMERGEIPASDVREGDSLLAWDFTRQVHIYREVLSVQHVPSCTWYIVEGYRISPLHPVWKAGEWRAPHAIGKLDFDRGVRVKITVEGDDYSSHNYFLVGREHELLIHNVQINAC